MYSIIQHEGLMLEHHYYSTNSKTLSHIMFSSNTPINPPHLHMHPDYEILLIPTGYVNVFTENTYVSHNGSCLLIYNKYSPHAQVNNENVAYEKYFLTMPSLKKSELCQVFKKFCQSISQPAVLIPLSPELLEYLEQPFKRLLAIITEWGNKDPFENTRIVMLLGYLLDEITILLENHSHIQQEKCDPYIMDVLTFIYDHLTEKISLQIIAEYVQVGKTKLNIDFQKYMHMTVVQYIIQQRLKLAQKLLLNHVSVEESADKSGFYDVSHMIRTFKKYYHVTPTEYRNLILKNDSFIETHNQGRE